jgi:hypothetical protein
MVSIWLAFYFICAYQAFFSTSRPLEGDDGCIYGILAGQPPDPTYTADLDRSFELMQKFSVSE